MALNAVNWFEIEVKDGVRAKDFNEKVFGSKL
jgi:predicted enzyme related to lactoylglutathione lyase